jgi:hypothetical protein
MRSLVSARDDKRAKRRLKSHDRQEDDALVNKTGTNGGDDSFVHVIRDASVTPCLHNLKSPRL